MSNLTTVFRYDPPKRNVTLLYFGYFSWPTKLTFMSGIWWHMTLISNVRYQKKRNESDNKLNFQNLVLFMMIGTKSLMIGVFWVTFLLFLSIYIFFVREYRTRRPGNPHLNERCETKPQTSQNSMQKTRPRYLNLESFFYWGSVFAHKITLCITFIHMKFEAFFKKMTDNVFLLNSSFPLILGLISICNIASSVNRWSSRLL